jgi:hypothetical protein
MAQLVSAATLPAISAAANASEKNLTLDMRVSCVASFRQKSRIPPHPIIRRPATQRSAKALLLTDYSSWRKKTGINPRDLLAFPPKASANGRLATDYREGN